MTPIPHTAPVPPSPELLAMSRRSPQNGAAGSAQPREPDGLGGRRAPFTWRELVSIVAVLAVGSAWAAVIQYELRQLHAGLADNHVLIERMTESLAEHVKQPGHAVAMERWDQSAQDRADLRQELRELRTIVLGLQQSQVALRDHLLGERRR